MSQSSAWFRGARRPPNVSLRRGLLPTHRIEDLDRLRDVLGHSRQIDGVVLTKFDTVSDKVGAALTMTHVTGAPIVFVGTGQKYNHLRKLSVQAVIKSMFS